MPITWLDILLLSVMLISGILAMIRGFMREVLSIAAWGAAAVATLHTTARDISGAPSSFSSVWGCRPSSCSSLNSSSRTSNSMPQAGSEC